MDSNDNAYDLFVTDIHFIVNRQPNPNFKVKNPNAEWNIMVFPTGGKAHFNVEGRDYEIGRGNLLFFPCNTNRYGKSDREQPLSFYSVHYKVEFANEASRSKFNSVARVMSGVPFHELNELFHEVYQAWTGQKPGGLIRIRGGLMQILAIVMEEMSYTGRSLLHRKAIERIIDMLAMEEGRFYSVEELSRQAGLSYSHFSMLFRQITGLPVIQYQHRIKMRKARDLLLSGECNVSEAARRLGFEDLSYFSRLFKRMTGHKPSDYLRD